MSEEITNPTTPATGDEQVFATPERLAELWAACRKAIGLKADATELEKFATPEAVANDIATALQTYAQTSDVTTAITTALAEYMTAAQTTAAIAKAVSEANHLTYLPVDALPDKEDAEDNVIYMVPTEDAEEKNSRDEYMLVNGEWELLGTTKIKLDNYWTKTELRPMTADELKAILEGDYEEEEGGGEPNDPPQDPPEE